MPNCIKGHAAYIRLRESEANLAAKKAEAEKNKPLPALNPVEIDEPKSRHRDFWTYEHLEYLRKNFAHMPSRDIANYLGKSVGNVNFRAREEKLTKIEGKKRWTKQDLATLVELMGTMKVKAIAKKLNRSPEAIARKQWELRRDKRQIPQLEAAE